MEYTSSHREILYLLFTLIDQCSCVALAIPVTGSGYLAATIHHGCKNSHCVVHVMRAYSISNCTCREVIVHVVKRSRRLMVFMITLLYSPVLECRC